MPPASPTIKMQNANSGYIDYALSNYPVTASNTNRGVSRSIMGSEPTVGSWPYPYWSNRFYVSQFGDPDAWYNNSDFLTIILFALLICIAGGLLMKLNSVLTEVASLRRTILTERAQPRQSNDAQVSYATQADIQDLRQAIANLHLGNPAGQ